MRYKYHWTLWIPVFGLIRILYIGFKYNFSGDSYPDKINPGLYTIYQCFTLIFIIGIITIDICFNII